MAGRKRRGQGPRCAGTLRDGTPCGNVVAAGGDLCAGCTRRAEEAALELVVEPELAEEPEESEPEEETGAGVAPGRFRGQLAEDLSADYAKVRGALLAAIEASTERYLTCPKCNRRSPHVIEDHKTRVEAVTKWAELGFGKAAPEKPTQPPRVLGEDEDLSTVTDDELHALLLSFDMDPRSIERERQRRDEVARVLAAGGTVGQAALAGARTAGANWTRSPKRWACSSGEATTRTSSGRRGT